MAGEIAEISTFLNILRAICQAMETQLGSDSTADPDDSPRSCSTTNGSTASAPTLSCNHSAFGRPKLDKLTGTLLEIPILSKSFSFIHSNESRMDVASTSRGEAIHAEVSCVELPSQAESRSTGKPLSSERRDRGDRGAPGAGPYHWYRSPADTAPGNGFGSLAISSVSSGPEELADARVPSRFLSPGRMGHACPRIPYLLRSPGGFTMDITHFGIGKCRRIDTEL